MSRFLASWIRLYPQAFRQRFGAEMADQIERDLARARGWRQVSVALAIAYDLLRGAVAERIWPTLLSPSELPRSTRRSYPPLPRRTLMDAVFSDVRIAARSLRRSPGFAIATIVTLALAIGVNSGIFSVVDTVLIDPLPYGQPDRLVSLASSAPGSDLPEEFGLATEFVVHYQEHSELLEAVTTANQFTSTLRADGRTERVWMSAPTPSVFKTLGVEPIKGRAFTEEDGEDTVVISHELWTSWLGSDPDVIGKRYDISGEQRTVVGVMPKGFWFPRTEVLVWLNNPIDPERITPGRFGVRAVGRLAPGVTEAQLVEELRRLALQLPERFGLQGRYLELIEQYQPVVRPVREELLGSNARSLWILLAAVGLVLLIACANVSNLLLVRTRRRRSELAVRQAIGASWLQLLRLQMVEAFVVSVCGGLLAVGLAWLTVPLVIRLAPSGLPRLEDVTITPRTLLFTFLLTMLAALVCGLWPSIRGASVQLRGLREAGRGVAGHWGRNTLVVAQTALALVLLIGSGLLLRSLSELRAVDPGYDLQDIYTFQIAPEGESLNDAESFARFHVDFLDRVRALPGVELAGLVENVPLNEGVTGGRFVTEAGHAEEEGLLLNFTWAGGDYFQAAGIDLLRGVAFSREDDTTARGNVVISRLAADQLFPGQDPIGQRIRSGSQAEWETVVGVVEDVLQYDFRDDPQPMVYYSLVGQGEEPSVLGSPAYVVRTKRAGQIGPEIRELVRQHAPNAPMYRTFTMQELAEDTLSQLSFSMLTMTIAASLALLLGALGLYGVLSFVVAERTPEIGLRMAIGAAPRRVQRMVIAQGLRVVSVGMVLGLLASLLATRVLDGLLFEIESRDAATFLTMTLAMAAVAFFATYLPARRASRVDPMVSLRGND